MTRTAPLAPAARETIPASERDLCCWCDLTATRNLDSYFDVACEAHYTQWFTAPRTAGDLAAGDLLHRVAPLPLSAVFSAPIDLAVERVEPFGHAGESYVRVSLAGPYATTLNLRTDRAITVAA